MAPKTRSSTSADQSKSTPDSNVSIDSNPSSTPSTVEDNDILTKVLTSIKATNDSIKANQAAIEAIQLKLESHSSSLDCNMKTLAIFDDTLRDMSLTVTDLPKLFETKMETIQQDLRQEFSGTLDTISTKFTTELSDQRHDMTVCFKNHVETITALGNDLFSTAKNLTALQASTLSTADVERIVVQKWEDELDPHIKSHYDFKQETTDRLSTIDTTVQDIVDNYLKTRLGSSSTTTLRSTSSPGRPLGFHQTISKDFSVSKLQKELKDIKLTSDTLKDIEIFWDAILGAFTNLCQVNQAFPYYRDLSRDFTFSVHFIDKIVPPRYLPIETMQVKQNYRSFGDALRIFLRSGTQINETSSPKAYLKLLSLCHVHDGFLLLHDLVFTLSPQLSGDYYDFRCDIDNLAIIPGEHLTKFYQRVINLSNEIMIANIQNGNMALLAYRFVSLLRSTNSPTITGLVNPYWKTITKHRRDPTHIMASLPWTFQEIYDDLISSDITSLTLTNVTSSTSIQEPFAARGLSHPPSSIKSTSSSQSASTRSNQATTIGIHRTKDGRKFISQNNHLLGPKAPLCQLCFNKHVNPWHPTENCPYKHPTQILPRDVRERVMQHNALHGAEKKDFTKTQDVQNAKHTPPQATGHSATVLESSHLPISSDLQSSPTTSIETSLEDSSDLEPSDEIIETEYFDVPFPPATGNAATSNALPYADIDCDSVITDHLQYLSYDS